MVSSVVMTGICSGVVGEGSSSSGCSGEEGEVGGKGRRGVGGIISWGGIFSL